MNERNSTGAGAPKASPRGEAGTKIGSLEPILVPDEEFGRKSWMNAFVSDL